MSQIILALIAIVLTSGAGVLVMTNLQGQSKVIQLTEDRVRLEEIADALEASIKRVPGTEHFAAPAAVMGTSSGWSELPSNVGMANATMKNVPYLYCPIGRLSAGAASGLGNLGSQQIATPGGPYSAALHNGVVVHTDLSIDGALDSQLRPVAILVAASTKAERPPNCGDVRLVDGAPHVEGGIVRVVSEPAGAAMADRSHYGQSAGFWVQDGASGSGENANDPMNIDLALRYFINYQPDQFTLNVIGYPKASPGVWSAFANAAQGSGSSITLRGAGSDPRFSMQQSGYWPSPAKLTIENLTIYGQALQVEPGDRLALSGGVKLYPSSAYAAINVEAGGYLELSNANVAISNGNVGIRVFGEMSAFESSISGLTQATYLLYIAQGEVELSGTRIGTTGVKPSNGSIGTTNFAEIVTDAGSAAGKANNGRCWNSINGDLTFAFSDQVNSRVPAESSYSPPTNMADQAAVETWQLARAKRVRARRQNMSHISCS